MRAPVGWNKIKHWILVLSESKGGSSVGLRDQTIDLSSAQEGQSMIFLFFFKKEKKQGRDVGPDDKECWFQ